MTTNGSRGEQAASVRVGVRQRQVHVHRGLTPAQARLLNLRAVTDALDAAEVDYFVVRGLNLQATTVGVADYEKPRVLPVLRALLATTAGYVNQVAPRPVIVRSPTAADDTDWSLLSRASVIRLAWFRSDPTGALVCDETFGCDVEFWRSDEQPGRLFAVRPNAVTRSIAVDSPVAYAGDDLFAEFPGGDQGRWRTRADFLHPLPEDIRFPIDVVYTWVDGSDPDWQRRRAQLSGVTYHAEAASEARYINRDEVRYSLRSIHMFAPWVRNVFLVTDGQVPSWLDRSNPRIHVVDHRDIFSDPSVLPVFNSCAIESQLHHIDGLSEHFIYFNDDMFLGRPLSPRRFFHANGMSKYYPSGYRVPLDPPHPDDSPTDTMMKNHRALLQRRFGVVLTQATMHAPYALQRSVLAEIEREFAAEHHATMSSRFRAPDNISITYSLHHHYAFLTRRAVPARAHYGYVPLAAPDLAAILDRVLARRDWDFYCINDSYSVSSEVLMQAAVLRPFLESYYPVPSPFEKA